MKLKKPTIIACDVDLLKFKKILKITKENKNVLGYKIGFYLGLRYSLTKIVEISRSFTSKLLIYDHQKAGNDIPEIGVKFAKVCKESGIDKIILFPFAGPKTMKEWVLACKKENLSVILGGIMTHSNFLESEGGFISDKKIFDIFLLGIKFEISEFVIPGTKLGIAKKIELILKKKKISPVFYIPGIGKQGAKIEEIDKLLSSEWYPIIGRSFYKNL